MQCDHRTDTTHGGRPGKLTVLAALCMDRLPQDCRVCKTSPNVRQGWGCDKAAPVPFAVVGCHRCAGHDLECSVCDGVGSVELRDCPYRIVPKHLTALLPYYSDWKAGRLPVEGGLLDQSNYYVEAMRCLEQTTSRFEADEMQQRMEANKPKPQTGDDLRKMFGKKG